MLIFLPLLFFFVLFLLTITSIFIVIAQFIFELLWYHLMNHRFSNYLL